MAAVTTAQTCPRRLNRQWPAGDTDAHIRAVLAAAAIEGDGPEEDRDVWQEERGYRFCSYCGSLHPDELMRAAVAGCELTPTDKSYKLYVTLPETKPDDVRIAATTNSPDPRGTGWIKVGRKERRLLRKGGWGSGDYRFIQLATRGPYREVKFYFPHLRAPQRIEFARLYADGALNLAFPGRFYTPPGLYVPEDMR